MKKDYEIFGVSNELTQVLINLIQNSKDAFIQNNIEKNEIKITIKEEKSFDKK